MSKWKKVLSWQQNSTYQRFKEYYLDDNSFIRSDHIMDIVAIVFPMRQGRNIDDDAEMERMGDLENSCEESVLNILNNEQITTFDQFSKALNIELTKEFNNAVTRHRIIKLLLVHYLDNVDII